MGEELFLVYDEEIGQTVIVNKERKEEILDKQLKRMLKEGGCVST